MCIMSQTHGHDSMTYTSQTPLQAAAQHQHHFPLAPLRVLQCVVVCCSEWQCVAVCCSVLQCAAVSCSVLQCVAVFGNIMQCVAVCCSVLQCVAACCREGTTRTTPGPLPTCSPQKRRYTSYESKYVKKRHIRQKEANTSKRAYTCTCLKKVSIWVIRNMYMPQTKISIHTSKETHIYVQRYQ